MQYGATAAGTVAWDDADEQRRWTRWLQAGDGARRAESTLVIDGMHCAACSIDIENTLQRIAGVESAEVNPATRRARVRWDPARTRASALAAAIEAAGYHAFPASAAQDDARRQREQRLALWRLFVAGFCMMQVMMYAAPLYWVAPGEMSPDIRALLQWASWLLSIPVVVFCGSPFLRGAWNQLRRRRIGMDVPVALGIVVTFVASTGAAFDPSGLFGSEVYFDSLTMFIFFLLCGRYLETRARHATAEALEALMRRVPETAERVLPDGSSEHVGVGQLRVGDRVRVRPGQAFPADGRLRGGDTRVNESLLTGESHPLPRSAGQAVLAGSFNLTAPVVMEIERIGDDTRYAQIVALMERASTERPEIARLADRIAAPFLWAVLLMAGIAAVAWSFVDPSRGVWVAVSVLIVTCPCALSLAMPSALLASAGTLARHGMLVQRLGALESLARAQVFVFDKTGTLTEDRLVLTGVDVLPGWTRVDALRHAASLASASLHPVARAVAAAAAGPSEPLDEVRERPGEGMEGRDTAGRCWRLGSRGFALGQSAPAAHEGTAAWLSVDREPVVRFDLGESVRSDARLGLSQLATGGVQLALLSGDSQEAAQRVASTLGIDQVHANASPEDKLRVVSGLQADGLRVAMVGDGINDGPVLARADVSVAMGHGAPLARAQADFTLLSGRIDDLALAHRLSRRTLAVVRQNLAWAALYNAVCVPLALAGLLPPWLAGLGMALSSLLVVANSLRLRRI